MKDDWQNWIDRLKSKDLTEAELREFQKAIEGDPVHRDAYLAALLAEVALESEDLPEPFAKPEKAAMPVRRRWPQAMAIAAGIVLLAAASYFAGSRSILPTVPANTSPSYLATITDADGIAERAGLRIGQPLGKGPLVLPEGSEIGIAMRGGARLKVRGPAELEIDAVDKLRLTKGRVSTYAPTYAHGFSIDTVDGSVVDLGTRFVTAAGAGAGTEIHVLEGLVEAYMPKDTAAHSLKGEDAAILKGGKLEPTEFLAQRLVVPLDPILLDRDTDGSPDVVESYYGTRPDLASSKPAALRVEEAFNGYPAGSLRGVPLSALGGKPGVTWDGAGSFEAAGLSYGAAGKPFKLSAGALRTTGETGVGAILIPDSRELPPIGVTYVSFLMQNPGERPPNSFAGLLLYQGDREELFVGKLSIADSYGSRLKQSSGQDAFGIPMDTKPHLFVVRIDRNRLVTDVFIDPAPGRPEASATQQFRYQSVPDFDRIVVRSGCRDGVFPSVFDEIRVGLTWDSVLPAGE